MPLPDIGAPALSTIRFDLAAATGLDAPAPASRLLRGKWTFTPIPGARSATSRLAPKAFQVQPLPEEVADGFFLLDLFTTDDPAWTTAWCWKVREPWPGTTRHVLVPTSGQALEYAALLDVDPGTLTVLPGQPQLTALAGVDADRDHVPDWVEALVRDQTTRIADLEAAVLALQAGGPANPYATAPIGDSPAAVEAYVHTHVEEPASAGYIGGALGGFI